MKVINPNKWDSDSITIEPQFIEPLHLFALKSNLRLTVDRPLGGGDWRRRRRGVDGLLGGGRFVDRSSRGGLGVHRLGWSYGDRGRGWRGRDVDRVRVGLQARQLVLNLSQQVSALT